MNNHKHCNFAIALCLVLSFAQIASSQPSIPEWSRGMVWYQILPDRFCNGDSLNDPSTSDVFPDGLHKWELSRWTANWYKLTATEMQYHPSFYPNAFLRRYGGDLKGIQLKLDYLQLLGIDGIVTTPLFESPSAHKFDVSSYHHIDHHYGSTTSLDSSFLQRENLEDFRTWYLTSADRQFTELIKEIHKRHMKIVVTTQFVHGSVQFWAFKDVLQHQERSKFGNWFVVESWDKPETPFESEFKYQSMWNVDAFPRFRQDSLGLVQGPKEYVFACTRRWMDPNGDGDPSDGIDGWKIDLTKELPLRFWSEWVRFVKTINPEVLVIGSGNSENSEKEYSHFDLKWTSVFPEKCTQFILNETSIPSDFDQSLATSTRDYTLSGADAIINFIDDIETDRLASRCNNPTARFENENSFQKNRNYLIAKPGDEQRNLQKLILLLQFTLPGSPLIYYGDETGMWGGDDPDCRKPMVWPELFFDPENSFSVNGDAEEYRVEFDTSLFNYYQQLIGLRKKHVALRAGTYRTVILDDVKKLIAYARHSAADRLYVVCNAGNDTQDCKIFFGDILEGTKVLAPLQGLSFFAEKDGLQLTIPPKTGVILVPTY